MKANSENTKQSNKATHRVLAGVLCGASVLSLVLSLVMPPISQAIANDAQAVSTEETVMGGGSSSESTDVDDTTNGDTENQNSDETEGDETGDSTSEVAPLSDGAEAEDAAQPADDGADDENAIAPAAENESTYEISSEAELSSKLLDESLRINGAATFKLTNNIDYNDEIRLDNANINITLNLNGHKIKHDSDGKPLFDIAKGATLTVVDDVDSGHIQETVRNGEQLQDKGEHLTAGNYGKTAKMSYDDNDIPTGLTYYVTESTASGAGTTEKICEHTATIQGAIVGVTKNSTMKLINVYEGGKFNLQGGTLTQKKDCNVGNLIYAENGSTVNMSGGYVCGASTTGSTGAGIMVSNEKGDASTLKLTGGVIAGNCASSGGGVYARRSAVTVTGGIISGNSTLGVGLGGGIMAEGGIVTVSGGYITNNKMAKFCGNEGWGCHGGAGLAANNGANVTISGGQITGNYSEEAGGGVYVTDANRNTQPRTGMAWLKITGGIIASNVSYRSEGAGIRVGQMVDAMIGDATSSKVYITNNHCMSRFDWGGGGIFVQGNSDAGKEKTAGRLFVYNSYISSNTAGGYGGGVAVCPTGKTLVTNTNGTAIFGNSSAGSEQNAIEYKPAEGKVNDGSPHLSAGGADGTNKTEDQDAYNSEKFRENGHADFFLAAKAGHKEPLAAIIGKMLGGGDAKYSGSKELNEAIKIPADGGVQIYQSIGLTSDVHVGDAEANNAQAAATTFITGNYSWDHGGGIMSNGDLYLGVPADTYVYPSLKLKATKALSGRDLKDGEFSFTVYRKDSDSATAPNWNNKTFSNGDCTFVGSAKNSADGNITFDLGEQFLASGTGEITYYLAEDAGNVSGVDYDHAVYKIKVTVEDRTTVLMSVPTQNDPNATKDLKVHNYTIKSVNVVKNPGASAGLSSTVSADDDGYYSIANSDGLKTFTNTYTKYDSKGSWTPKATKVVEGGEMKEFTLEFADNLDFTDAKTVKTKADDNKPQTLEFPEIEYKLGSLKQSDSEVPGRGASKTFTYYVREKTDGSWFSHYKFDKSVYKITVNATDQSDKTIKCDVKYTKIVNADGKDIPENEQNAVIYVPAKDEATGKEQSVPVFTNTYSTSLPLSGMSGVTLTYLAGAAVLCAAAAWMHIRRKANAKGGERRE
ncbi:MAG TPA: hypothetical protein OIL81_08905 [Coriobacteriaceae bacterium]|nr:hypothetical protein [Coriobacteriaceae bacterium]